MTNEERETAEKIRRGFRPQMHEMLDEYLDAPDEGTGLTLLDKLIYHALVLEMALQITVSIHETPEDETPTIIEA